MTGRSDKLGTHLTVTGALLAGGRSSRFGANKALALWKNRSFLHTLTDAYRALFPFTLVVVKKFSDYSAFRSEGCRIIEDIHPENHALGGIVTALEAASTDSVFIAACDMPMLEPALVRFLCARHRARCRLATAPFWGGEAQPLCAVYSQKALPVFRSLISRGRFALQSALNELNPEWVSENEIRDHGIEGRSFFDIDTPQDYEKAKALYS